MNWSKYEINLVYFSRLLAIHQEWVFKENGKMIGCGKKLKNHWQSEIENIKIEWEWKIAQI